MQKLDKFSPEVCEKLGFYVYGLIDPRNGKYFYIGKGQNNRIFEHIKGIKDKDEVDEKIKTIMQIRNEGLEVLHLILRHGLKDDKEALNIESTLIDFIGLSNLDNKVGGINQDKGINNALTLQKRYSTKVFDENETTPPFIIIKVRQEIVNERNESHYEACRWAWKVSLEKVKAYKYVLCVVNGIVERVFEVEKWQQSKREGLESRYEFIGKVAPQEICVLFVNQRIPEHYRKKGNASPVCYSKKP